jgi:hypothetical protein
MRRKTRTAIRNRLDLADRTQVRVVSRRLRLSEAELAQLVDRVGNSITALSKEVALRRAVPPDVPSLAVATKALAGSELNETAAPNAGTTAMSIS